MTEPAQHQDPQRLRALEQANLIRLARAELKRRIADGEVSAADVIVDCPDEARRWPVGDLLRSQRRWGITRCRKFLEKHNISEIKLVGSLTERQRTLLATQLRACNQITERAPLGVARAAETLGVARVAETLGVACAAETVGVARAAETLGPPPRVRELVLA